MKIIDAEAKGNVLRLYLGKDSLKDWWSDDWDDVPYEHNSEIVYDEFVEKTIDIAFPFNYGIYEPATDWTYNGNSPFCKDDFKNTAFIIITKDSDWSNKYTTVVGRKDALKITLGDKFDEKKFINYGGTILKRKTNLKKGE